MKTSEHDRPICISDRFLLFSLKFTGVSACGFSIPSGNVAPMSYPLLCASFVIKTNDYGQDFRLYLKTKRNAADKTLGQRFLKEFKATCKNSSESELK